MKTNHITTLSNQADHFFAAAKETDKAREKIMFTDMALTLLREAQSILKSSKRNSLIVFFEFMVLTGKLPTYEIYLEFCARNDLDILSKVDYQSLSLSLHGELDDLNAKRAIKK